MHFRKTMYLKWNIHKFIAKSVIKSIKESKVF